MPSRWPEQRIGLHDGVELHPPSTLVDRALGVAVVVEQPAEWALLTRVAGAGGRPVADLSPSDLARARAIGPLIVRLTPGQARTSRGVVTWLQDRARPPGTRRDVRHGAPWWRVLDVASRAAWEAYWWVLPLASAASLLLVLAYLDVTVSHVVGALTWPLIIVGSAAAHEAAHVVVLRRQLSDPAAGAFLSRLGRLCVLRTTLEGRRLRAVAAAGPLAGAAAAVVAAPLALVSPWYAIGCLFILAFQLGNLAPVAPDGGQLCTGREAGVGRRADPGEGCDALTSAV